jgi:hypothetical protein
MTQILACPCKTAQILLDINWCSVANILKAAVTDLVLLLGIPITLVNLQKAPTRIKRAGKEVFGGRLSSERAGKISTFMTYVV